MPMASKPHLMTTTLWDFPSQQYGDERQGDKEYTGATPAWVIWNLLQRYTLDEDLVVDPMAGSGTTLDVARDLGRRALGYDLQPTRKDIFRCDARKLPLEDGKADFVFVDPPYSTHVKYSGLPECIGELDAEGNEYYAAMETAIGQIDRILRPDRFMALYVSDSFRKGKPFCAIGFELFALLRRRFEPVDVVAVVRRNRTLLRRHWHTEAAAGNFFLRGFNYLFIMYKPGLDGKRRKVGPPDAGEAAESAKPAGPSRPPRTRPARRKPGQGKRGE
jgi:DNA modification methylase